MGAAAMLIATGLALVPFARQQYRLYGLKARLQEAIARDAGYTETILKLEKDAPSVTYQELFELCDKSINKRTDLIAEVRGLYPDVNAPAKEKLIEYLNSVNGFVRSKKAFFTAHLRMSSILDTQSEFVRRSNAYQAAVAGDLRRRDVTSAEANLSAWNVLIREGAQLDEQVRSATSEAVAKADAYARACDELARTESESERALRMLGVPFRPIFRAYHRQSLEEADKLKGIASAATRRGA